jgi:glycosyltransferase involved in cell wall biosynthesis
MRVGILTGSISRSAGGISEAVRGLALELHHPPAIEVSLFGLKDRGWASDPQHWNPLSVTTFSVSGPRSFGYARGLLAAIQDAHLDVLHVHGLWMYSSIASFKWKNARSAPRVISPHGMLDSWALSNASWKKKLAAMVYEARHLRGAACIHALCDAEVAAIRAFGLKNPVCVIPNGVVPPATNSHEYPAWRQKLPDDVRVILYLGRLHPKKGLSNLLHAWREVKRIGDPTARCWQLVIAGWNQVGHGAELETLSSTLGITDTVWFVGPQFEEEKDRTFRAADAVILPSFSEGLPVAVLEAWAHRRPVIMTPQCNLPEGFVAGAALAVDPEVRSLVRQLRLLFAMSQEQREAIGEDGFRLVSRRFTWTRAGAEMGSVYRWLLDAGPRPDCVRLN